jgi:hypothetical protein
VFTPPAIFPLRGLGWFCTGIPIAKLANNLSPPVNALSLVHPK